MSHSTISLSLGLGGGKSATSSGAPGGGGATFSNTKSCHFDGMDDHIAVTSFNFASAKTVSYWIKLDSISSAGIYIFGKGASYYTYLTANGQTVYIHAATGPLAGVTALSIGATHAITTGSWIHLAIVGDGTDAKLYKNGVERASGSDRTPQGVDRFGGDSIGGSRFVNGKMDEVAYFASALSPAQVTNIYKGEESGGSGGTNGTPGDLDTFSPVHWWRMGDGDTFATLSDHGKDGAGDPSGNDGTMTNMDSEDIVEAVPPSG